jgi:hypothetical protein
MSRRQRLTLLAAIYGSAVATIDGSIVNVALPVIERNLGGGLADRRLLLACVRARALDQPAGSDSRAAWSSGSYLSA